MGEEKVKYCPRCNSAFECKAYAIEECQCNHIHLSGDERAHIAGKYSDCLCVNCLRELKEGYNMQDDQLG